MVNIIPELVTLQKNGYYSVNYINLVPVLVEAIKQQQSIINEQNNKIENIEKEMTLLKEMVVSLNKSKNILQNTDRAELINNK